MRYLVEKGLLGSVRSVERNVAPSTLKLAGLAAPAPLAKVQQI